MSEQRISRLTPLDDAVAALDALAKPIAARQVEPHDAIGQVLAADAVAGTLPPRPTALQDGWAVRAEELADAGGYAPAQLGRLPQRVEVGDEMPAGMDAVAPLDAIMMRDDVVEAVTPVTAGEGVSPAGSEADRSKPLRKAGERMRALDAAVLAAANTTQVSVRVPRVLVVTAREDLRLMPALEMVRRACAACGGEAFSRNGIEIDDALRAEDCDAIIVIGGTGTGQRDRSVRALAQAGKVVAHGVGLTPGETLAFGQVGPRPVLVVPGRLDNALGAWLILGRRLLKRLSGSIEAELTTSLILSRKVTSTIGLAEVVPVLHDNTNAGPLAAKNLPLWALARANGWLLVPPDSEGYPAGARVAVNPWP